MASSFYKYILKKKKTFFFLGAVVFIVGGVFSMSGDTEVLYDFIIAERSDIVQEIQVIGRVEPLDKVELSYVGQGRVEQVSVRVGDIVEEGELLVVLNQDELYARKKEAEAGVAQAEATLAQVQATLEAERANLSDIENGVRPEEIRIQEVEVQKASIALSDAKNNLFDTLYETFTRADDAVRNNADAMFLNARTDPQLLFAISDSALSVSIVSQRSALEPDLVAWKLALDDITTSDDLIAFSDTTNTYLYRVRTLLDDMGLAVNNAAPTVLYPQSTLDTWKAGLSTSRSSINSVISTLTSALEKRSSAEANATLSQEQLALKEAGATQEQINAQRARVKQAEASVYSQQATIDQAQARLGISIVQIRDAILRAPIGGVVTVVNAKVGEVVRAGSVVVSIISAEGLKIEANIPEADIVYVQEGHHAFIILDAYGADQIFEAQVLSIEPAETIIDGVATYKTTLLFTQEYRSIRSGMTTDISIVSGEKSGVITVPMRAVLGGNGERYVRVVRPDGSIVEQIVRVGLRGSSGDIEIVDGIFEGDKVIIFLRQE